MIGWLDDSLHSIGKAGPSFFFNISEKGGAVRAGGMREQAVEVALFEKEDIFRRVGGNPKIQKGGKKDALSIYLGDCVRNHLYWFVCKGMGSTHKSRGGD
jgi:hypothetical protein